MILLELKRDLLTDNEAVGVMSLPNGQRMQTIERPWIPNPEGPAGMPFQSCLPVGLYRVERHTRPSGERALILSAPELGVYHTPHDIPPSQKAWARSLCLVHAANWAYELHGCIGPGIERKKTPQGWMVTRSRETMNTIRNLIGTDLDIKLRIDPPGG